MYHGLRGHYEGISKNIFAAKPLKNRGLAVATCPKGGCATPKVENFIV